MAQGTVAEFMAKRKEPSTQSYGLQLFDGSPAEGRLLVSLSGLSSREVQLVMGALHQVIEAGCIPDGVVISYVERKAVPFQEQQPELAQSKARGNKGKKR